MADPVIVGGLLENPLFAGGAGLATIGAAVALGRRGVLMAAGALRRRLLIQVEIGRQDPAYPWMLAWLARPRPEVRGVVSSWLTRIHNLSVSTTTVAGVRAISGAGEEATGTSTLIPTKGAADAHMGDAVHFSLQPGFGRHIVKHGKVFIGVSRERLSSANMHTGEPHELLQLTTLWAHRYMLAEVLGEAHEMAARARQGKTAVYTMRGMQWGLLGEPRRKRPLDSVVLADGIKETLLSDVQDFLSRREWYADRGIPYRRGYLLHGPPGCGKTSVIQALAGAIDYGVAVATLSEAGVTDDRLASLLTRQPRRTVLLLEDADAAFFNRRRREADGYSGSNVTFSGLLNALDGVVAGEERITFLTTNHPDLLDPALVRPGRVDLAVRVGEAGVSQVAGMWDRFYGEADSDGSGRARFLSRLQALGHVRSAESEAGGDGSRLKENKGWVGVTPAQLQGVFLLHKEDMEGAILAVESLVPKPESKQEAS